MVCDPVPVNLAQAMKQIVPAVQDLKRRSMQQAGGETTMPPCLVALRDERVVAVVTAPRMAAVLECAQTVAVGMAPQMLVVAAQVNLPTREATEDTPAQQAGEGIAYTTFSSDKKAALAVQRYQMIDGQLAFRAPERGRPSDRTLMDDLARAMAHEPLDPGKVARKDEAGEVDEAGMPVNPSFIPTEQGRMALDSGTIKAVHRKVSGIGGTALYLAATGAQATQMLAHGLPEECLLS